MLRHLRPAIPLTMTVIVLAERGLYTRWLYRRIVRLGWHPVVRIKAGGPFRPQASTASCPCAPLPPAGYALAGPGTPFVKHPSRLACTLLAWWEVGYQEA